MTKNKRHNFKKKKSNKKIDIIHKSKTKFKYINNFNNQFNCPICNITFSLFKNMIRHKNEQHEKKNFKCCPYCLKDVPRYKEHIQRCKNCVYDDIISLFTNFEESNFLKEKEDNFSKNISFEFSTYKAFDVKIGEGGFGNVFYGMNHENSFPLALKIFKNNNLDFYYFKREIDFINIFKDQIFFPKIYHYIFSDNKKLSLKLCMGQI